MVTSLTIRVVDIPSDAREEFVEYIKKAIPGAKGHSLAPSVSSIEDRWVATISLVDASAGDSPGDLTFSNCKDLYESTVERDIEIKLSGSTLDVSVDAHFHGLTLLNHTKTPAADIIVLTGLSAHAYGSFKANKHDMWLRDFLPLDLAKANLQARIMIFGYDSKLAGSDSHASIHDYAMQFLEALKNSRYTEDEKTRPLILLGHSLGGLVIKHALNEAAHGDEDAKKIIKSCYALLFFGTPNRGMDNNTLISMVKGQPNDQLVRDLGVKSQYLPALERNFIRCFRFKDSKVFSFYETKETPTVKHVDGKWQRTGPKTLMVTRYSATGREEVHHQIPLDGDHSDMVKFRRRFDQGYQTVRNKILVLVKEAPEAIKKRFAAQDGDSIDSNTRLAGIHDVFDIPLKLDYPRNQNFTGRESVLSELHQSLFCTEKAGVRTVVVRGTGGMGKSQLVRQYVYLHENDYKPIFWVNATSLQTTHASFIGIAKRLVQSYATSPEPDYLAIAHHLGMTGLFDKDGTISTNKDVNERVVDAVKAWLNKEGNNRWLLVFDNLDDLDSFRFSYFFPAIQGVGHIIVTSRRVECARADILSNCTELVLDVMTEKESVMLLAKSSRKNILEGSKDYEEAAKLVKTFGGLPLAIDQAGAYIHRLSKPLSSYLPIFERNLKSVLKMKPSAAGRQYDNTVFTTWEISFSAIKQQDARYGHLLLICSFFSCENITTDLLARGIYGRKMWPEEMSDMMDYDFFVENAIATLVDFSLVTRSHRHREYNQQSMGGFSIHPLVHFWARERFELVLQTEALRQAFWHLGAAISISTGLQMGVNDNHEFESRTLPHIDTCATWLAQFRYLESDEAVQPQNILYNNVRSASDQQLVTSDLHGTEMGLMEVIDQRYGRNTENSVALLQMDAWASEQFAVIYKNQVKYNSALKWHIRALGGCRKVFGDEHPDTLKIVHNIAANFLDMCIYDEALKYYFLALEGYQRAMGESHPPTMETMHEVTAFFDHIPDVLFKYLGYGVYPTFHWVVRPRSTAEELQKDREALEWHRRVLDRTGALGEKHPSTLDLVTDIATVFAKQGKNDTALQWYSWALGGCVKVRGDDHPSTLQLVNNIAVLFGEGGKYEEAVRLFGRALAGRERLLGEEHPATLETVHLIGALFGKQEKYDEALQSYERALAGRKKVLGEEHLATLETACSISTIYAQQAKYDKAIQNHRRVLAGREKVLGEEHPTTLEIVEQMAIWFYHQRQYDEALQSHQRALAGKEKTLGEEHPATLETVEKLAHFFAHRNQHDEALQLYTRALAWKERFLGEEDLSTLETVENMAISFAHPSQDDINEALQSHRRALAGKEKVLGEEHPSTLETVEKMALFFDHEGQHDEALQLYRRALAGKEKVLGEKHPSTLETIYNMALFFDDQGQYNEAMKLSRRALFARLDVLGAEHPLTVQTEKYYLELCASQSMEPFLTISSAVELKALGARMDALLGAFNIDGYSTPSPVEVLRAETAPVVGTDSQLTKYCGKKILKFS